VTFLLDTHAFLWFLAGDSRLRPSARRYIQASGNVKLLSIASAWEMAIKVSLRKLELDDPLADVVGRIAREHGVTPLAISEAHVVRVATLPWHHRDPFDRLLVAQALENDLPLLTDDPSFERYGVRVLW
jgi:PIN domain nuclease of toxin-antitoxin system